MNLKFVSETVPDLETAKIELDKICDLIFSSETTSILSKLSVFINLIDNKFFIFIMLHEKQKNKVLSFYSSILQNQLK